MATLCGLFGYSRQSYYKYGGDDFRPLALEPILVERVKRYREENPRLGSVKLWLMLKRQLDETGCFPGRDAFIEMLRRNGLMVRIRRRHHYVTTDSNHNLRKYPNLVKGLEVTEPNRVRVSDITYVETAESVLYLSLVTDLYSHKIVGWAIGPTLEREYPLKASRMAMATLPKGDVPTLIHHSDRGCQYCSSDYVEALRERKIQISMTQTGDPLENPVAERANGILKTEWLYHMEPISEKKCPDTIGHIIAFYNNERPHMSIGYQTPSEAYKQSGEQKKCWKNPWDRPKETGKTPIFDPPNEKPLWIILR